MDRVARFASQKAVLIFSESPCCMCHAIKRLFYDQGVSPVVYELDELDAQGGQELERALLRLGWSPSVLVVFIGSSLVGSANAVMTLQLNGSLKRMLREAEAGAIWLWIQSIAVFDESERDMN